MRKYYLVGVDAENEINEELAGKIQANIADAIANTITDGENAVVVGLVDDDLTEAEPVLAETVEMIDEALDTLIEGEQE